MTEISVDKLRELLKYDPETGKLIWLPRPQSMFKTEKAGKIWNTRFSGKEALNTVSNHKGHFRGMILWATYSAHQVCWALHHGEWPEDQIDHINGDSQDNRLVNLRPVNTRENCRNQGIPKNNTSGVSGVHLRKDNQKWRAYINGDKGRVHLGTFSTKEEAVNARASALVKFGYHENHGRAT